MKNIALAILVLLIGGAPAQATTDTTNSSGTVTARKTHLKATTRIHSMGFFSYGGRLVSQNNVMDLHIVYNHGKWGAQFFKACDLSDSRTPINFAMMAVNRPFHIGNKLTVTPHAGIILEQFESLADHGSDAAAFLVGAYKVHPNLTLEYTAMVANLVVEPGLRDWVNRVRCLYSKGHLDVTLFAWHNNQVFDASTYGTVGLSVFMSRIPLAGPFRLQTGITGLYMASASDERTLARANGLFLSMGVSVN